MPRRKNTVATATISSVMDLGSEDDFAQTQHDMSMIPTPDSTDNKIEKRKQIAAAKRKPISKAKDSNKASSMNTGTKRKIISGSTTSNRDKRTALKDVTNVVEEEEDLSGQSHVLEAEDDEDNEEETSPPPPKRAKPTPISTKSHTTTKQQRARPQPATSKPKSHAPTPIPEPQDVDEEPSIHDSIEPHDPVPATARPTTQPTSIGTGTGTGTGTGNPHHLPRAGSTSQRAAPHQPHHRARSASSTERGLGSGTSNDAASATVRRRLGDLTARHEALQARHAALQAVASAEASGTFEALQGAGEARVLAMGRVVEGLKGEVRVLREGLAVASASAAAAAAAAASNTEGRRDGEKEKEKEKENREEVKGLARQVKFLEAQGATLTETNRRLTKENAAAMSKTAEADERIKALERQLATTKAQAEAAVTKANAVAKAAAAAAAANNSSATTATTTMGDAQVWKMKEDIYADLTGLMIRGVKRIDGEDVFDCMQTGRNGTLRFNLAIEEQGLVDTAGAGYDEIQMTYTPLIDEKNDKHLVEILEDFLVEDICFPRSHAQGFYSKVRECMTRRIDTDD